MGSRLALPWRGGAIVTGAGIALALLGPYRSYLNGPLVERLVFWLTSCWMGFVLYGGLARWLAERWRGRFGDWAGLVIGALFFSVPEAWLARTLAIVLWPRLGPALPSLPLWFAQTVVLGLPFTVIGMLWSLHRQRAARPTQAQHISAREGAFSDIADVGNIVALQIEDHYVRVHRAAVHGSSSCRPSAQSWPWVTKRECKRIEAGGSHAPPSRKFPGQRARCICA